MTTSKIFLTIQNFIKKQKKNASLYFKKKSTKNKFLIEKKISPRIKNTLKKILSKKCFVQKVKKKYRYKKIVIDQIFHLKKRNVKKC